MQRVHRLLVAAAAATLLTACDDGTSPAAPPSLSATSAATASSAPSTAASTTSPLTKDMRDAYQAAMAAHPGADLDRCTQSTPLTDKACGAAITAAGRVAADTARRLRARSPEHAELLYGGVFTLVSSLQDSLMQLRDPIPCYGLGDKPQPPLPLRAEAQSICAEAASIAKVKWQIFVSQVA